MLQRFIHEEYEEDDRIKIVKKMRRLILPNEHTLIKQGTEGTDLYRENSS